MTPGMTGGVTTFAVDGKNLLRWHANSQFRHCLSLPAYCEQQGCTVVAVTHDAHDLNGGFSIRAWVFPGAIWDRNGVKQVLAGDFFQMRRA